CMLVLQIALAATVCVSWIYWLLCLDCARRWASKEQSQLPDYPSTQIPNSPVTHLPSVSILKPLCGSDPEQLENFRSFCRQYYSQYQIVFGALEPNDAGLKSALQIKSDFPDVDIEVIA